MRKLPLFVVFILSMLLSSIGMQAASAASSAGPNPPIFMYVNENATWMMPTASHQGARSVMVVPQDIARLPISQRYVMHECTMSCGNFHVVDLIHSRFLTFKSSRFETIEPGSSDTYVAINGSAYITMRDYSGQPLALTKVAMLPDGENVEVTLLSVYMNIYNSRYPVSQGPVCVENCFLKG